MRTISLSSPCLAATRTGTGLFASLAICVLSAITPLVARADTSLVSRATGFTGAVATTGAALSATTYAQLSDDGRYFVFDSTATNLGGTDTNVTGSDVFLRDAFANTTTRITGFLGRAFAPVISENGRYIVFKYNQLSTQSVNLPFFFTSTPVGWPTRTRQVETFVIFDRTSSSYSIADRSNANVIITNSFRSFPLGVSDDGRFVLRLSLTNSLNQTAVMNQIQLYDTQQVATTTVSRTPAGNLGSCPSSFANMTPDGARVVFFSRAPDLVSGDNNGSNCSAAGEDLFLFVRSSGSVSLLTVNPNGTQASGIVGDLFSPPGISDDGRYVSFLSKQTDLISDGADGVNPDVYVRDTATGTTTRIESNFTPTGGLDGTSLSDSGLLVLFPQAGPLYRVRNLSNGTEVTAITNSSGDAVTSALSGAQISGDGNWIASSSRDALVSADTNSASDLYVSDVPGVVNNAPTPTPTPTPSPRGTGIATPTPRVTATPNGGTPVATAMPTRTPRPGQTIVPGQTPTPAAPRLPRIIGVGRLTVAAGTSVRLPFAVITDTQVADAEVTLTHRATSRSIADRSFLGIRAVDATARSLRVRFPRGLAGAVQWCVTADNRSDASITPPASSAVPGDSSDGILSKQRCAIITVTRR